ncbi:hypothetical protein [Geomobilimonas luticola]|uniref:Uncharacterized protein n=1 Tax=Geomobilimonas luticola TaxID=1114878 RepID=A0ABS5SBG8_9BACT|nr:hypothetical protein [Geomobilimonas luticola]MBT0652713.1 hypothetical protein [Geomobilimonas luticola]
MTKSILRWGLMGILIWIAPLIFVEVQGYITIHAAFPVLNAFSAKSIMALAIFTIFNFLCAILTAIPTALPCGYLAKKQSKIIAILIIISIQSIPVYLFFQEPKVGTFVTVVWIGQFVAVVISAFAFAEIGRRMAAKRQNNAAV